MNDGTEGTPNHHCLGAVCYGDWPKLGVDKHGVYITTNELPFFEFGPFPVAQIYALSKSQMVAGAVDVRMVHFNTNDYLLEGHPGFSIQAATTPVARYADDQNGTEYLLSSVRRSTRSSKAHISPGCRRPPPSNLGNHEHELA